MSVDAIETPAEAPTETPSKDVILILDSGVERPATAEEIAEIEARAAAAQPSEAETVAAYMAAVQRHMDALAVSFGYDNLISVITYAEEPAVPRYQAEGQAFRAWRSACWLACEQMLAAVKAGERSAPTHAELIAELPELGIEYSGPFAPAT